jgi:hypothetical protein
VGAAVLMAIAMRPMLNAGYDTTPGGGRHYRRRHAGIPDSALNKDHRVRGGCGPRTVGHAAAMFPGFFGICVWWRHYWSILN